VNNKYMHEDSMPPDITDVTLFRNRSGQWLLDSGAYTDAV
jgi:hypothetical protein